MKKITTFVLLTIAFSTAAIAQFDAKKIAIGGNIGIDYQQNKYKDASAYGNVSVAFLPEIEGFLTSRFSIGGRIGYLGSFPIGDQSDKITSSSFLIGPYVKQYFSLGDYVAFFIKENMDIAVSAITTEYNGDKTKATGFGVGIGVTPGLAVKLSRKVMFETSMGLLGFSISTATSEGGNTLTQTNVSVKVNPSSIQFGVKIIL